jgi:prolipoprotein diacylglyceryltransferase
MICCLFIYHWHFGLLQSLYVKYYAIIMLVAIILDIVWLSLYKESIGSGEQDDSMDCFVWVMSLLSVIVKFLCEGSFFLLFKTLS